MIARSNIVAVAIALCGTPLAAQSWGDVVAGADSFGPNIPGVPGPGFGPSDELVQLVAVEGTCGLSSDGRVYCWQGGRDSAGAEFSSGARPVRQPPGAQFERIAGSCAVQAWGQAHCWASGRPIPAGLMADSAIPVRQGGKVRLAQWDGSCGVTLAGRAYCYDLHLDGLMGPGPTGHHAEPRPLLTQPPDLRFVSVGMSGESLCGITDEGAVHCLSLARGHDVDRSFRRIVLPAGVVAADFDLGPCILTSDRVRVCWEPGEPPLPTVRGTRFVQTAPGIGFGCALTDAGDAYCWGDNEHGQLGDGRRERSAAPVRVRPPHDVSFVELTSGDDFACALGTDAAAYCWGHNDYGQLGDGTTEDRAVPVRVRGTGGGRVAGAGPRRAPMTPARRLYGDARTALAAGDTTGFVVALTRSAEAGYAPAQNDLGEVLEYGRGVAANAAAAAGWYRRAAEQGDAPAQRNLGSMYQHGVGVGQDLTAALTWYRRSADQDHGPAQNDLGYIYLHGQGIAADAARAAQLFTAAAEAGDAFALANLAFMHEHGHGMPRDPARALQLYRAAAAAGHADAARSVSRLGAGRH